MKILASAAILSLALIISSHMLARSISDLASTNRGPKEIILTSNGQQVNVTLDGRVGFSDSQNPVQVQQVPR